MFVRPLERDERFGRAGNGVTVIHKGSVDIEQIGGVVRQVSDSDTLDAE
jgi:hypothetical protein